MARAASGGDFGALGAAARARGVLTTGEAAGLLRVSPRTLAKLCDRGLLPSYRLAGSNDRRVGLGDFADFVRANVKGSHGAAILAAIGEGEGQPGEG
jgi:excisionase family DNA binding protein